jgi:hypothetical protein
VFDCDELAQGFHSTGWAGWAGWTGFESRVGLRGPRVLKTGQAAQMVVKPNPDKPELKIEG